MKKLLLTDLLILKGGTTEDDVKTNKDILLTYTLVGEDDLKKG